MGGLQVAQRFVILAALRVDDAAQVQQIGALLFGLRCRLWVGQVQFTQDLADQMNGGLTAIATHQAPNRLRKRTHLRQHVLRQVGSK